MPPAHMPTSFPFTAFLGALLLALPAVTGTSMAQPHFDSCAMRTGHNATIIIPAQATLGIAQHHLDPDDEIAIFSPEGVCAGTVRWTGENVALTVWGDDDTTSHRDGLLIGDPMQVRIWDASEQVEYGPENSTIHLHVRDNFPYLRPKPTYMTDAIFIVDTLRVSPRL